MENSNNEHEHKQKENIKEDELFEGDLKLSDRELLKASLKITRQLIIIKFNNEEILIPYRNIIFFAINKEQGYLLIEYSLGDPEKISEGLKFFCEHVQTVYDAIQYYNIQHPTEEFLEEPEGDNELYTSESFQ